MMSIDENFSPCLLVSMPQMQDPNFTKTVSLLSEFSDRGAVALILNRPLQISIHDVLAPDFRKQLEVDTRVEKALKEIPVYWGGPVDVRQGLIIHNCEDLKENSVSIGNGIYITGSIKILLDLLKRSVLDDSDIFFRFLLGYAGWDSQQLEQEMSESCWITTEIQPFVFETEPDDLWKKVVKSLGVEISQLASVSQDRFH